MKLIWSILSGWCAWVSDVWLWCVVSASHSSHTQTEHWGPPPALTPNPNIALQHSQGLEWHQRGVLTTLETVSNYSPSSNIISTLQTHHTHHPSQTWGAAQGQKSRWSFSGRVSRDSHLWSTFKFCLIDWGWCFSERGISKIWRWCWSSISVIVNKSLPYKFPPHQQ